MKVEGTERKRECREHCWPRGWGAGGEGRGTPDGGWVGSILPGRRVREGRSGG